LPGKVRERIWTIGHSDLAAEDFIACWARHGIELLAACPPLPIRPRRHPHSTAKHWRHRLRQPASNICIFRNWAAPPRSAADSGEQQAGADCGRIRGLYRSIHAAAAILRHYAAQASASPKSRPARLAAAAQFRKWQIFDAGCLKRCPSVSRLNCG